MIQIRLIVIIKQKLIMICMVHGEKIRPLLDQAGDHSYQLA